jgi:hypothetical protein
MDPTRLSELSPFVEWEEDVQWLVAGAEDTELRSWEMPSRWQRALGMSVSIAQRIVALWSGLEPLLPRTIMAFAEKAHGLALLRTRQRGLSLVYVFKNPDTLTAYRGFMPLHALPPIASQFPVNLAPFYGLHDGLVHFMSHDAGPLPVSQWQTLIDPDTGESSLVKIATDGPNAFGFDVSESPAHAYGLFPDEDEVRPVQDPWTFLDDLLAGRVEEL